MYGGPFAFFYITNQATPVSILSSHEITSYLPIDLTCEIVSLKLDVLR